MEISTLAQAPDALQSIRNSRTARWRDRPKRRKTEMEEEGGDGEEEGGKWRRKDMESKKEED